MGVVFDNILGCVKQKKLLTIILLASTILVIILGVFSALNFDNSALCINLNNVLYIKYLAGDCGVTSLIFGLLFSLFIYYFIILLCCSKNFLIPISVLFYLYFVYSQTVIFVSLILIYGFLNTIILLMLLLCFYLITFALFMLLIVALSLYANQGNYIACCFNKTNNVINFLTICFVVVLLIFIILLIFLKSFVLLLVF